MPEESQRSIVCTLHGMSTLEMESLFYKLFQSHKRQAHNQSDSKIFGWHKSVSFLCALSSEMAQGHYIEISLFFVSLRNGLFKLRSKRIRSLPLNPLRRASVIFCIPSAAVPVNSTLWLVIIPIVSPSQVLIDQLPTVATDSSGGQGHFKALQGHQLRLRSSISRLNYITLKSSSSKESLISSVGGRKSLGANMHSRKRFLDDSPSMFGRFSNAISAENIFLWRFRWWHRYWSQIICDRCWERIWWMLGTNFVDNLTYWWLI